MNSMNSMNSMRIRIQCFPRLKRGPAWHQLLFHFCNFFFQDKKPRFIESSSKALIFYMTFHDHYSFAIFLLHLFHFFRGGSFFSLSPPILSNAMLLRVSLCCRVAALLATPWSACLQHGGTRNCKVKQQLNSGFRPRNIENKIFMRGRF